MPFLLDRRHGRTTGLPLAFLALAACLFAASCGRPPAPAAGHSPPAALEEPSPLPTAGGVELSVVEDEEAGQASFDLSFPVPMVPETVLGEGIEGGPLVFAPAVATRTIWFSPSTARVLAAEPMGSSTRYRVTLAPDLKDAAGSPLEVPGWFYEFSTPRFELSYIHLEELSVEESRPLPPIPLTPHINLAFTAPVIPAALVAHSWFRDRETQKRTPIEIILQPGEEPAPRTHFVVAPREPLRPARTYDFVIDGLTDAVGGQALPYLNVTGLGITEPLRVEWVGGFNQPLTGAFIQARFSEKLDPASATPGNVEITPAVKDLRIVASADDLFLEGAFDPKVRYRVTFGTGLLGWRGIGLSQPSTWGATFKAKRPAVIFPQDSLLLQPAAAGLQFDFYQVNTGELTWRIASVPEERASLLVARLREFDKWDRPEGWRTSAPTRPLIDEYGLPEAASGTFPASQNGEEVLRTIRWKPGANAGLYLLEVTGQDDRQRLVGNRILVSLADWAVVRKDTPAAWQLRVIDLRSGAPAAGGRITLRGRGFDTLAPPLSLDERGEAHCTPLKSREPYYVTIEQDGRRVLQSMPRVAFPSGYASSSSAGERVAVLVSDRNLYRPGETVYFKIIARARHNDGLLLLPPKTRIPWKISCEGEAIATGDFVLNANGGAEAEWKVPAEGATGWYSMEAGGAYRSFTVEEFRSPLFSVAVEAEPGTGPAARAEIRSEYFHGAANAQARVRWSATWMRDSGGLAYPAGPGSSNDQDVYYQTEDAFSPQSPSQGFTWSVVDSLPKAAAASFDFFEEDALAVVETQGDAVLDAAGHAVLECPNPFPPGQRSNRSYVVWNAEVTSIEGQTFPGGAEAIQQGREAVLGVRLDETKPRQLSLRVVAFDVTDGPAEGVQADAEVFLVRAKTALERLSRGVARYRNTLDFEKLWAGPVTTPAQVTVPIRQNGRYVAIVRPAGAQAGDGQASDECIATRPAPGEEGETGYAEFPVEDNTKLRVHADKVVYQPGETAVLAIEAPFAGNAWVSVETDRVLRQFVQKLDSNAGRIEVPIEKSYAPNAYVSVYLFRPGTPDALPAERFGFCELRVADPDRRIKLAARLPRTDYQPGEVVEGQFLATSAGNPVAGAEVTVFAVDEAILDLGGWSLPNLEFVFYPTRTFAVTTYEALTRLRMGVNPKDLTQKGFIVGDGGAEIENTRVRRNFLPLAFWNATLTTDSRGSVPFSFIAPDSLTAYRIVAVAHSRDQKFGSGEAKITLSKPLQAEPALPRFLRNGDTVDLRVILRQRDAAQPVAVSCTPGLGLALAGPARLELTPPAAGTPAVAVFTAKVGEEIREAKVRFSAVAGENAAKLADAVEVTLPVRPPTLLVKRASSGRVAQGGWEKATRPPDAWQATDGTATFTVSTTPWLPKVTGLPAVLEYPYGCFEQTSSRILAYSLLTPLLDYLPVPTEESVSSPWPRREAYESRIREGLEKYGENLLPSGGLPYWPGGSQINAFATVQAAWSLVEAEEAGLPVDEAVRSSLLEACSRIARKHVGFKAPAEIRALAWMILAVADSDEPYESELQELYLDRARLTDEGRALLALAMFHADVMPEQQRQLLAEIKPSTQAFVFDPRTFSSPTRSQAIVALARAEIEGPTWPDATRTAERNKLLGLLDSSVALSTQENLWLLLAFRAVLDNEENAPLALPALFGVWPRGNGPNAVSPNQASAAWLGIPLDQWPAHLPKPSNPPADLSWLINATYRGPLDPPAEAEGLKLERVLVNLTDRARTGTPQAPFRLGDQVLVTYHIASSREHSYLALEDQIPACLETVNPNLPLIAATFRLPEDASSDTLDLSHSELRDDRTLLFFDSLRPGKHLYAVLARVTSAGAFRWPATQASPMYDARFRGSTSAATLHATP